MEFFLSLLTRRLFLLIFAFDSKFKSSDKFQH